MSLASRNAARERIACGHSHPEEAIEARVVAMRANEGAPLDNAGCGRAGIWTVMYRCVECGRWFHRDCILRHFAAHTTPAPIERATIEEVIGGEK